jgi:hypothetical protein
MDILVLDTIHGGNALAAALSAAGYRVDRVDVYRGAEGISRGDALSRRYDLIVSPVHLGPAEPLLRETTVPVISHHDAVRWVIGRDVPSPMVEITGARGKTTTAHALASVMRGAGILHSSSGTFRYPERTLLGQKSITPASVIGAVEESRRCGGWLIAEESLGVTGAGDLAVITSERDYPCACGSRSALAEKLRSGLRCRKLLVAPGVPAPEGVAIHLEDMVTLDGARCVVNGISFSNPLLELDAYRTPLALAAAAACILGLDPSPLSAFVPITGRLSVTKEDGVTIVDDANSGVNAETACDAARYARTISGEGRVALVIGRVASTVCEGFPAPEIARAIRWIRPAEVVYVSDEPGVPEEVDRAAKENRASVRAAGTLAEGKQLAMASGSGASVVLAVKTWR